MSIELKTNLLRLPLIGFKQKLRLKKKKIRCKKPRFQLLAAKVVQPLAKNALDTFVTSFRQASPYIVEHANSLFVIVIPGEVSNRDRALLPSFF